MATEPLDEQAIFEAARKLEVHEARDAYLQQACGGDPAAGQRIRALLKAYEEGASFLEAPAAGSVGTIAEPNRELRGSFIGPYKLIEQIGEGGMGTVWMAQQTEPVKRLVAVKLIKAGMDSKQVIARFEVERQALAIMDHPNIARVLDGGTTAARRPYFVMDLVRGVPITRYCDEHHLTPRQRLELFIPVCQAIQHAHQKGIIHRDLKPSNVLIALYDGKPVPKVIDFGVAKAAGQRLTEKTLVTGFGNIVGTLEYMSPEQVEINQLDIDTRSDIYALGVLLYELLTGGPPFSRRKLEKAGIAEMLRVIREEEPSKPSVKLSTAEGLPTLAANRGTEPAKLMKLVRGELDWIVMKALEKDRSRRYETANGFATDVQRYLADEPVLACPPSVTYRLCKFARRNKAALATAGLFLAFIVLLGGLGGWAVRDRTARHATLNHEIQVALQETNAARERALTLTGNPFEWQASLAAATAELKRAEGLAAHEKVALRAGVRERLQELQVTLASDESDFRFAQRFEEIRLDQAELNEKVENFKAAETIPQIKDAFRTHYGIEFATSAPDQVASFVLGRPEPIRQYLVAALEYCQSARPQKTDQEHQWLTTVLNACDTDPWRRQLRAVATARDWPALERVLGEASMSRLPPGSLILFAMKLPPDATKQKLKLLRQIQDAHLGDFWANHELGMVLHFGSPPDPGDAVRFLTAAAALRPQSPGVHLNLGIALTGKKDWDSARRAFERAIALAPGFAKPHIAQAQMHNFLAIDLKEKREFDAAIDELRKSVAACRRAAALAPKQAPLGTLATAHNLWGLTSSAKGDRDGAKTQYQEAIRTRPDLAPPHSNLGFVCMGIDDDAAIAEFREAIRLDKSLYNPRSGLGAVLAHKGMLDEAIIEFREAVRLNPGDANCHFDLGHALFDKKRFDEAIASYREASRLKPNHAASRYELGHALRAKGAIDEAIDVYRELVRLKLADAQARVFINNQFKERAWQLATQANSKPGDIRRAAELASEIVALQPNALNWNRLGVIRYWARDWQGCIEAQNRSIELDDEPKGGNSFQWFFLAMAYGQLGERVKAREWHDRAVAWMDKHLPMDNELRRYRVESSELLEQKENSRRK